MRASSTRSLVPTSPAATTLAAPTAPVSCHGVIQPSGHGKTLVDDDEQLLARIAENDQTAFRHLVERHIDRAYALALRILQNPADADDVVQDTMLKVWTLRGTWQSGRARFSTWLYRVVANRCIDLRRRPHHSDIDEVPDPADGREDALSALHRAQVGDLLEAAMLRLPDHQRIALILSYHENLANAEIAEVMETTVAAVESLLKRGRQQLRQFLRRSEGEIRQSFLAD